MIADGMRVKLHFSLKVDGQEIQSTYEQQPFEYTQGSKEVFPAMQKNLEGLSVGDEKNILLKPEEGFGQPKSELVIQAPKDRFEPASLQVGAVVSTKNQDGTSSRAHIKGIHDDTVTLDFNHPLAGKTLNFDVQVLEISGASA
ncbi:MAG: FKBP-type peptidyl-prolyl cis-trans isomerase [Candidatus Omnitrophica bacterium]|nr:FKBP-type peptidyl-prolyl cis-trans isomerase [Candidatus Omnitrophota bacterium]